MTFSPMIRAAGADPDPAGIAPDPATSTAPAAEPESGPAGTAQPGSPAGARQDGYPYRAGQDDDATGTGHDDYTTGPGHDDYTTGPGHDDSAASAGQEADPGLPWPHQSYLELGALPTAAPCARLHTSLVLWEWHLGALVETAALVVSELVSNAVQAAETLTGSRFAGEWAPGTPPVRLWLSADDQRVVIQVWDGSDRTPVLPPVEPEADCGRGLLLVGALSSEWGCYTPENSSGKVVWAVVSG